MTSWYSETSKLVMPPLTDALWCSSHQIIILSYARAASVSWSKQPSEVGFPARRNCASQRRVGKVWCTPRYLEVKVRPACAPFCFTTLVTFCTDCRRLASPRELPSWEGRGVCAFPCFRLCQSGTCTLRSASSSGTPGLRRLYIAGSELKVCDALRSLRAGGRRDGGGVDVCCSALAAGPARPKQLLAAAAGFPCSLGAGATSKDNGSPSGLAMLRAFLLWVETGGTRGSVDGHFPSVRCQGSPPAPLVIYNPDVSRCRSGRGRADGEGRPPAVTSRR
mmetsp:Transcript_21900/g.55140  ORF Transcript_21900/g.55140 Transcript_21900/m.55140 type:complete len:278 (+) Transcript_21900:467-1300(+)